ncbi:TPA: 4'-phosphopantetheinyl transferase superfamily protein [Bacillus cereus]|uniref:4'-phosphopantetheinyl transferase family protein n=1 Tax=Bacillus cereus group sp. FL70 TaxID=3040254 RepID=UPI0032F82A38|nr:4'-phosphopantetheinyl transferase superfamily protein [Bacillus cereus]
MEIYAVEILDISEEELKKLSFLIDSEKKHKIEKYIEKKDKIRTLVGEILIRTIIIEKLKTKNRNIKFSKNQYGKPYLKGHPEFNFSISHSGEYVLCAVDNKPIGIDIEKVKDIDYKDIAKKFFTENEFNYIINQDINLQLNKFYEIWTLKESYIKCCGQGLSIPLDSFSIEINQFGNVKVVSNNEYKEHILNRFDIELDYKISVCSLNTDTSCDLIEMQCINLIEKYLHSI